MTAKEARQLLLGQHERLRQALGELERLAKAVAAGSESAGLRARAIALGEMVRDHNLDEERLLQPILKNLDAWGPERIDRLIEHHADEHAALHRTLDEAASEELSDGRRASAVLVAVRELTEHMECEERELLAENVLRDDVITDGFCG